MTAAMGEGECRLRYRPTEGVGLQTRGLAHPQRSAGLPVRPLGVDLRKDWPKALCDAGFDPELPTAWCAEGLLVYLPAAGQHLLFDRIQALSAKGSRSAVDVTGARFFDPENLGRLSSWFGRMRESFRTAGVEVPDTPGMWFDEDRTDVSDWLQEHGWAVESVDILDLMTRYQRDVPEEEAAGIPACDCISGQLN